MLLKKAVVSLGILSALVLSQSLSALEQTTSAKENDPGFMGPEKQLTFVGPRSGEGYFSHDGKQMVFQAERQAGNPFYQIYLLNFETGKTERISPGQGQTTCSWIHPSEKKVMFSSTHLDPMTGEKVQAELAKRSEKVKSKYSWAYDDQFDIFTADFNGKNLKRLTKEKGYDAEGSYSPDGKWIAFASNRAGYTEKLEGKLEGEDLKIFERDSSHMMDIYRMRADGTQVERLTNVKGYDGGPFFSADGKKITWRRFSTNGQLAEIWTMNSDGSDQKQITRLGKMSWAPYFHPSGDYLIFTSNKLGYENFELFIVDAAGLKDPVRVSFKDGFDGLPVFSPDGAQMAWTHRNDLGESQIYISAWNDELARKSLGLGPATPRLSGLKPELAVGDVKQWVNYLASEKLQGRKPGTVSELEYTTAIAAYFKELGLKPYQGSYLQAFDYISGIKLGAKNVLSLNVRGTKISPKLNEEFIPLSISETGEFKDAPVVFGGYGMVAPATDKDAGYDSYKDLDVQGKWVLVFRDIPEGVPNERRVFMNRYSRLQHKALVARQAGAVGLLVTNGPNSTNKKNLISLRFEGANAETSIPVLSVTDALAEKLIQPSGKTLKQWQTLNDTGEVKTSEIVGTFASAQVELIHEKTKAHNVLAVLEVPGAKSSVAIGAHGDHLGLGDTGSSLARGSEEGAVHFGADDNASGVSATLEVIHDLKSQVNAKKIKLKKSIIVGIWSAEEVGLLGAHHFLKNNKTKIDAYVNLDMVGRLRDVLSIQGLGSAAEWKPFFEGLSVRSQTKLGMQDDPYLPTDAMAFYMNKIPAAAFFTGAHSEYHTPRDIPESLNYSGIVQVANVVEETLKELAQGKLAPQYIHVEGSGQMRGSSRSFRIYLGTIPDYSQEGIKGVKISGTSKDSPAEKAGLVAGDVIVEVGSTKIENIYDYVYVLQAMKPNEVINMKVLRAGRTADLKVTPVLKE